MGYNTTVVVLNDALDQIAKDQTFGKKLVDAIISEPVRTHSPHSQYVSAGNHANAAEVIESHHASYDAMILVGGNTGKAYLDMTDEEKLRQLKMMASTLGYRLSKKPQRK